MSMGHFLHQQIRMGFKAESASGKRIITGTPTATPEATSNMFLKW